MLNDQALDKLCRGVCRRTTYETVLSHQDIVAQAAYAVGLSIRVRSSEYGGGSTAARVIVRQLRLAASAATAVFGVLNDQALDTLYRGVCSRTTYETVLSCQDVMVQAAFTVGLELPCS